MKPFIKLSEGDYLNPSTGTTIRDFGDNEGLCLIPPGQPTQKYFGNHRLGILRWLEQNSDDMTQPQVKPTRTFKVGDLVSIDNVDSVYHMNVGAIVRQDKNCALEWVVSFGPNDEDFFSDDEMNPVKPEELEVKPPTLTIGHVVTFAEGDTGKVTQINHASNYPYGVERQDGSITWVRIEIAPPAYTGKFKVGWRVWVEPRMVQGVIVSVEPDAHKPYAVRFDDGSEGGFVESDLDHGIPF